MGLLEINYAELSDIILKVFLAAIFGMLLGIERDKKNKPIDFRAYMIICVATCLVAILSQYMYYDLKQSDEFISLDLGKIISGVLTGIGFLGAGAIIKKENDQIIGTATGASIWAAGIVGLCLGFGAYLLAVIGFGIIFLILIVGGFCISKFSDDNDIVNIDKD